MKVEALAVVRHPCFFGVCKGVCLFDGVHWVEKCSGNGLDGVCFALGVLSFDGAVEHFFTDEQFGPKLNGFFRVLPHPLQFLYDGFVAAGVHHALKGFLAFAHSNF